MKKLLSVLLAVLMLLSAMPVMAETEVDDHKHEGCPGGKTSEDGLHWACADDVASDFIPATCVEDGHRYYYCQEADCDDVFKVYTTKEENKAKGHTPKLHESGEYKGQPEATVVTPATCEVPGVQKLYCTTCEEYYTAPIAALEHAWVDVEEEFFVGTCTEDAYKVRYCTNANCPLKGAHQKYDIVKAPGHDFTELKGFVENVDCETDGIYEIYKTCSHNATTGYAWNCEEHSETAVASVELKKEVIAQLHQAALETYIVPSAAEKEEAKAKKVPVEYIVAERIEAAMDSDKIVEVAKDVVYPGTNYEDQRYTLDFDAEVKYVPADCTEKGYVELTCTTETGKCYVKFEIPALGHVYTLYNEDGELFKEKDANCLKNGSAIVKCNNPYVDDCDFIEQVEIKAPGKHNFESDDCMLTITQEYEINKTPVTITIPAKNYTKNAEFIEKIAPCTEYSVVAHCCGFTIDVDLKNGEWFYYDVECSAKDDAYTVEGDETKHDFDESKFAHESATCTTDGWDISYCEACGKNTYREYKAWNHVDPATGYSAYVIKNYETDVVEATCTEPGSMKLTCSLCDDVITKVIPATGHGWDKDNEGNDRNDYRVVVTKEMTCKEAGSETWYCDYCQETQIHAIPIKHVEPKTGAVVTDSTCTIAGSKSYVCEKCHDTINETIDPKGHTFERPGYTTNFKYEGKYYDGYVPATCQNEAYYWRVCTDPRCDKAHKDLKVMTEDGLITGKYYEVAISGEKMDHLLVASSVEINGEETEIDVNLIITKLPTCCTTGEATFNCALCEKRATMTLPALGHNEKVTWNKTDRIYEVTCQPYSLGETNKESVLTERFGEYMYAEGRNYLNAEIKDRIDPALSESNREFVTALLQGIVIEDLYGKMIQQVDFDNDGVIEKIIRGVGCKEVIREIKVNKTHYDATMKDNGDGTLAISIEIVENAAKLAEPRLIVSWAYTLSDGTSMTVTGNYGAPSSAYEIDANGSYPNVIDFTVPAPEVDFTTELVQTTIAVTTGYSTDMGAAYANGYGWDVIVAK